MNTPQEQNPKVSARETRTKYIRQPNGEIHVHKYTVAAQQPQHSPLPAVMSPEPTTLVLRSDLLKLNKLASNAEKLAEALQLIIDTQGEHAVGQAERALDEYQNAKGGE